ncbi:MULTISPECIES: hypothetical protein [unclassified Streptomyces]|uniref:hypothetical protein n=1 Tax=unclassified Streptomyces TaxID=2593676 RepID=UPI000BAC621E|nr:MULTISPECIES: hypothetical protein [unclassified Streptomyces]ASY37061.1 hypothetical protein CAC01_30985 [Streptomyces sp. CLI2509]MYX22183.1 hypothetical protein [Streptomyces sp. SID8380]
MALTFFTRRPEPALTEEVLDRARWPETGESWTPEGVTVAERYYNLAGAVVLVYTTSTTAYDTYYAVACLGCHYATREEQVYSTYSRYELADAAKVANAHASSCRALPRTIPARPGDDTVRERLHSWVRRARHRDEDVQLWISDLDLIRLTLQRPTAWIEAQLQQLADDQPDVLRIERSRYGDYLSYYALQLPEA